MSTGEAQKDDFTNALPQALYKTLPEEEKPRFKQMCSDFKQGGPVAVFQQGATELCRKYSPELQGRLDEFCKLVEDAKRSRVQNAAMTSPGQQERAKLNAEVKEVAESLYRALPQAEKSNFQNLFAEFGKLKTLEALDKFRDGAVVLCRQHLPTMESRLLAYCTAFAEYRRTYPAEASRAPATSSGGASSHAGSSSAQDPEMAQLQQEMGKLAREIHASLPPEKQGGFTDVYSEFRKGPNSRTLQRYKEHALNCCVQHAPQIQPRFDAFFRAFSAKMERARAKAAAAQAAQAAATGQSSDQSQGVHHSGVHQHQQQQQAVAGGVPLSGVEAGGGGGGGGEWRAMDSSDVTARYAKFQSDYEALRASVTDPNDVQRLEGCHVRWRSGATMTDMAAKRQYASELSAVSEEMCSKYGQGMLLGRVREFFGILFREWGQHQQHQQPGPGYQQGVHGGVPPQQSMIGHKRPGEDVPVVPMKRARAWSVKDPPLLAVRTCGLNCGPRRDSCQCKDARHDLARLEHKVKVAMATITGPSVQGGATQRALEMLSAACEIKLRGVIESLSQIARLRSDHVKKMFGGKDHPLSKQAKQKIAEINQKADLAVRERNAAEKAAAAKAARKGGEKEQLAHKAHLQHQLLMTANDTLQQQMAQHVARPVGGAMRPVGGGVVGGMAPQGVVGRAGVGGGHTGVVGRGGMVGGGGQPQGVVGRAGVAGGKGMGADGRMVTRIELNDAVFYLEREKRHRKGGIAYKSFLRFHTNKNIAGPSG